MKFLTTVSVTAALAATMLTTHAEEMQSSPQLPVTVPPPQPLNWQQCPEGPGRDCATLTVPLNYADLSQGFIELPVARRRASSQSLGVLVYNPGGPTITAGSQVRFSDDARLGSLLTPELVDRFDIVAFNARGTTDGIACFNSDQAKQYWQTNHFSRTTAEYDHLLALERAANQRCLANNSPLVRHVDTASGIRDVEQLRRAMGVAQLNFLGFSYGTFFGIRYAVLYPGRVKSMVLDAVMDRSVSDLETMPDRIIAYEQGWTEFKQWCQDRPTCRLRGQDIDAVFDQVLATARSQGIPAPFNFLEPDRPVNDWELVFAVLVGVDSGITHPYVEEMIVKATQNDASLAGLLYDSAAGAFGDGTYFEGGTFRAISCIDTRWSQFLPNTAAVQAAVLASKLVGPRMGEASFVQAPQQCHGYPIAPVEPPPVNSRVAASQPPFLVVGGTKDRSTPGKWAENIARQNPNSRLIIRNGNGHVSLSKSRCVQRAVNDYFVRSILPANRTQCPTDPDLWPPDQQPPDLDGALGARVQQSNSIGTAQQNNSMEIITETARRLLSN